MTSLHRARSIVFFAVVLAAAFTLSGCLGKSDTVQGGEKTELIVSSAPSLKDSLEEIEKLFCEQNKNIIITFNYGPSGSLQNQIEQGAAADIFISQGKPQMDALQSKKLILEETRVDIVSDELVLITEKSNTSIGGFEDLTKAEIKKVAIGVPDTVPAAKTAREMLETLNLWDKLEEKLVMGKDLMQVMSYVESGNAEAGFVWDTIAKTSDKVRVAAVAPEGSHKAVSLPAAVVVSSKNPDYAKKFLEYIRSETAIAIFEKYGFKRIA